MGYSTVFEGEFKFNRTLTEEEAATVNNFCNERHDDGYPSNWCDWKVDDTRTALIWNWDTEKFYNYVDWLRHLIDYFFFNWGVTLNGTMKWQGESKRPKWCGTITIKDNAIKVRALPHSRRWRVSIDLP